MKTLCAAYLDLADGAEELMHQADEDENIIEFIHWDEKYTLYMKLWANHLGLILKSRRKGHIFS